MKSITRREIAILVVIFMAVPFALWGAISVIDLFLPTSPSDNHRETLDGGSKTVKQRTRAAAGQCFRKHTRATRN